jgi:hypothetical protein
MEIRQRAIALAVLAAFSVSAVLPGAALAQSKQEQAKRQKKKNDWRNATGAAAAVAGYGLLKHNSTATVLGAAGAAYSANRYEQERKNQSKAKARRERRYHRHGGDYVQNGRKYYTYGGHRYYMDMATGARHRID